MNPWSGLYTSQLDALNNKHRLKQLRKFIGVETLEDCGALDIGPPNWISRQMGIEDNTRGDLNTQVIAPAKNYYTVTFLEVLNHLQNHLFVLQGINKLMARGGMLYLSTPKLGLIAWSHGKGNYVELKTYNVIKLLEFTGFKVRRVKTFRSWPVRFIFYGWLQPLRWFRPFKGDTIHHSGAPKAKWWYFGLRPPLRWLLNKYVIIEAEKI